MKKILILTIAIFCMVSLIACDERVSSEKGQSSDNASSSVDTPKEKDNSDSITLEPDNEYMKISGIDISDCKMSDGYFQGTITYIAHTTQKYVDKYDDYFFRQVYFGFYNENGDLVGEEFSQDNHVYSREYTNENSVYVYVTSSKTITEVKVTKIVIEKPSNNK